MESSSCDKMSYEIHVYLSLRSHGAVNCAQPSRWARMRSMDALLPQCSLAAAAGAPIKITLS